ncbi:DUF4136 domain-containing protein [Desulfotalea psychrophila]|nr:DUF4136 domain-containing protein [Desulfotalea psychrophila]
MRKLTVLLAVVSLLAGCSSLWGNRDYNPRYDFSSLHSYKIRKQEVKADDGRQVDNSLIDSRIAASMNAVLSSKGFSLNGSQPDFIISYAYHKKQVVEPDSTSTGGGFSFGSYGNYGGAEADSAARVEKYDLGVLVLDVVDPVTGKLVWCGKGRKRIFLYDDQPEKLSREIRDEVEKILDNFPPR